MLWNFKEPRLEVSAPALKLPNFFLEEFDFLHSVVEVENFVIYLGLQLGMLVSVELVVFLLIFEQLQLLFLDALEAIIRTVLSEDWLLEQNESPLNVFKSFQELVVNLWLQNRLRLHDRVDQLVHVLPHLQLRHKPIDFQLTLPGQELDIFLVLDRLVGLLQIFWARSELSFLSSGAVHPAQPFYVLCVFCIPAEVVIHLIPSLCRFIDSLPVSH